MHRPVECPALVFCERLDGVPRVQTRLPQHLVGDEVADTGDEGLMREAARHGHLCLSAVDVVVLLKREQLIPAVRPVLDQMRQSGFGIRNTTYQQALGGAKQ